MRNERTDPIDALIDEAAHRLVAGEPSSSLRSGVRDRITRRSAWSLTPALAGASALVVAVLVGWALLDPPGATDDVRPGRAQAPPDVGRTLSGPGDAPGERDPSTHAGSSRAESRGDSVRPTIEQSRPVRRLAADVALPPEEESVIPPIAIEPLVTDPLTAVQIVVDQSSGVMPIEIAPLRIEPLQGD